MGEQQQNKPPDPNDTTRPAPFSPQDEEETVRGEGVPPPALGEGELVVDKRPGRDVNQNPQTSLPNGLPLKQVKADTQPNTGKEDTKPAQPTDVPVAASDSPEREEEPAEKVIGWRRPKK